jgi:hypothetical protein
MTLTMTIDEAYRTKERGSWMSGIRRRTLMRKGGLAASAATLFAAAKPNDASAEAQTESVFHVFLFQWKPATSAVEKERAAKEIVALQGQIPGLLQTHVGPNISPRGKGYTFGGIMQFKDKASLDAYPQHSAHQALLAWLVRLIDAIELDLCTR